MTPRKNIFRVKSLKAALHEFLSAPAAHGGINDGVVASVMGAKGTHVVDPPSFDAATLKYGKKCRTFVDAFNACWNGHRDWRKFDLETLQNCDGEDFLSLQLPTRVRQAMDDAAVNEELYGSGEEERAENELPPLELLRRKGPTKRMRRLAAQTRRAARCKGSRNACSKTALARKYRVVKREYHEIGEQLRRAGER